MHLLMVVVRDPVVVRVLVCSTVGHDIFEFVVEVL